MIKFFRKDRISPLHSPQDNAVGATLAVARLLQLKLAVILSVSVGARIQQLLCSVYGILRRFRGLERQKN